MPPREDVAPKHFVDTLSGNWTMVDTLSGNPTVVALAAEIRHLQERLNAVPLVHGATLHGGFYDGLWGPRCDPDLEWSVPLIAEGVGPSELVTCPKCIELRR